VTATGLAFSSLLLLLLVANWLQVRSVDPLESPALATLRARLTQNPEDEALREQIRALDLLARRAFFAGHWQQRTVGLLLLGSLGVTLLSARLLAAHGRSQPIPSQSRVRPWWTDALWARRWLAASAGGLLVTAAALVVTARSHLGNAPPSVTGPAAAMEPGENDWPFFRGPGGNGVAVNQDAPVAWDGASGRGIAWKVEPPLPGNSSPIVVGERVLLTGGNRETQEVYCYARETGELLWRQSVKAARDGDNGRPPHLHPDTGFAPSTMATDGARVFAVFPTGDLAAFDLEGQPLWSTGLGVPDNHYGHASSLITSGGRLIVQWDQHQGAQIVAYDAATGSLAWRTPRDVISWASPAIVDTGSRQELLVTNSKSVAGYAPDTGVLLWRSDCLGGEMGPSPAFADGLVFVANDRATAAAVRPGGDVVWEYDEELPDTASPVATGELVFLATSYGVLVCLDAKTGEQVWLAELQSGFYASPIVVGDRLYALDLDGVMHIVKVGRAFEPLAEPALGEPAMATPAFVGGRIYARGERFLYAIAGD
jgi:outer membrane protein assembly factor BamB